MTKCVLHIGSDKTGTSHIQSFLARNIAPLKQAGWTYPETRDTRLQAKGSILSGNGYPLFQAVKEGAERVQRVIRSYPDEAIVISSEALSALNEEQLHLLATELKAGGYDPVFVFYLRAPIDYFVSGVIQWAKRNGGTAHPLEALKHNMGRLRSIGATDMRRRVDAVARAVGRDILAVRNYSGGSFKGGAIEYDFLDAIGIEDFSGFDRVGGRTNPSLTEQALELILEINRGSRDGTLSARVSDALMRAQAEVDGTPVRIPRHLLAQAAQEFESDIAYLRKEYGLADMRAYTEDIAKDREEPESARHYVELCAATLRHLAS